MAKTDLVEGDQVRLILVKGGDNTKEILSPNIYTIKKIGIPSADQAIDKLSMKLADEQGRTVNALKTRVKPIKQEEEKQMEAATLEKPKTSKKPREPFDLKKYMENHKEGTLLCKECNFDHNDKGFKLTAYILVDPKEQFYYYVNLYKYPDGTVSRCSSKDTKYPLKGIKYTLVTQSKKTKETVKKPIKGKETAEEVITRFQKKDYKIVKL